MTLEDLPNLFTLISTNPRSQTSFSSALSLMVRGLEGKLSPSFYLFPFDTGTGKSTLILSFLAVWKAGGFKGGGSILIALATVAEIKEFAALCGLDARDFAAYTSDDETNKLGAGVDKAGHVRVLFTTHSMVRKRLANKRFESAREYHYHNQPRTLRLWDERCLRAEPIHIVADDLAKLLEPIRPYYSEWAEELDSFIGRIKAAVSGTVLTVPSRFGKGPQFRYVEGSAPLLSGDVLNIYKHLIQAGGKKLLVMGGRKFGQTLVGSGDPLPDDLAPMLIFDASGRIGDTYDLWSGTTNVVTLPPLVRNCSNLVVRIWKTACGRAVLEDGERRASLLKGIGNTLNLDPQPTLLIGSKARSSLYDLHADLTGFLNHPDYLAFRHWGVHHGTNEFRDHKRLVVVGAHRKRDTADQALYMAASGIDPEAVDGSESTSIYKAELQQNLLQAISRGSLRNGVNGECGECVVYLVVPPNPDPEAMIRETFPGCKIEPWEPYGTKLIGQAKAVFDALKIMVDDGIVGEVAKKEVRAAAGIPSSSRLAQVLANPSFANAAKDIGVSWNNKHFVINPVIAPVVSISEILQRRREQQEQRQLAA